MQFGSQQSPEYAQASSFIILGLKEISIMLCGSFHPYMEKECMLPEEIQNNELDLWLISLKDLSQLDLTKGYSVRWWPSSRDTRDKCLHIEIFQADLSHRSLSAKFSPEWGNDWRRWRSLVASCCHWFPDLVTSQGSRKEYHKFERFTPESLQLAGMTTLLPHCWLLVYHSSLHISLHTLEKFSFAYHWWWPSFELR